MFRFYLNLICPITFRQLYSMSAINTSPVSDNERKLSKRALKRLLRRQLHESSKMSEDEQKLAKQKKEQKKAERASLQKQEDLVLLECLSETDYYFENGLRKVYPYYYDFTAYAKGRWFGSRLVDIFVREFQNYTVDSCVSAINLGTIQVNGKPANVDHVIQNGDFILNKVHRHELPVTADPPAILVNDEEYLVVDKPASIPIHPCGRYRHNSLIHILAKEHGFRNLRTIYRLDRLTSGLVIFCKSETKTREMMRCIAQRQVQKEYLCQVEGLFPSGLIECNQPIGMLSQKHGIYKTDPNGKPSKTSFERIGYDGKNSIVRCKPYTGRTHQIRIHLQYLGYPISNDPLYKGAEWGPNGGKGGDFGKTDEEVIKEVVKKHSSSLYLDTQEYLEDFMKPLSTDDEHCKAQNDINEDRCVNSQKNIQEKGSDIPPCKRFKHDSSSPASDSDVTSLKTSDSDVTSLDFDATLTGLDTSKLTTDENCRECKLKYLDPQSENLIMYLHAFRYKGPGWEFSTPLPKWTAGIEVPLE